MTAGQDDEAARRRICEDLDATLVVEAAAGTGKTTALVSRIVSLLLSGRARLRRIVAVTFTEKAAGEMKLRLRADIERARSADRATSEERARLDAALAELEVAHIGTIHSLCAEVLRELPIEAQVDPSFEMAAGEEGRLLLGISFDGWFQRVLADPGEGVRRILRRRDREGPRQLLLAAAARLVEDRDFDAAWRRPPFDRDAEIDRVVERLAEVGCLASQAQRRDDFLAQNLAEIGRFVGELQRVELLRGRDHDGLESELRELARLKSWKWRGGGRAYGKDLPRDVVVARRDAARAELQAFINRADADLASCLREELRPVVEGYEALKTRAGKLDFLDLLVRTRDLIRGDARVRKELQERFTHLLVDEFQDTDPLQAEILLLVAADDPAVTSAWDARPRPGKLFVVGDPKQSIYRFRRADVAVYESVKRHLLAVGAELVYLTTSFRGVPGLQEAVNAAFAPLMKANAEGSQAAYVPLRPHRRDLTGQPAVVALPVPRPYGDYGTVTSWRIAESTPDAVGAFVDFLIKRSGWKVTERDNPERPVPIEARHVCLLFRKLQSFDEDMTRAYVRALEVRRIPHVLVGGRSYHAREEVLAVRNALTAVEWPDDELAVFAVLRGPFFALGDDALLAWRYTLGGFHPLRRMEPATLAGLARPLQEVAEALAIIGKLHAGRNRRPIADTISRLLDATRAHAGIAIWPTGEQALANILRVMDLARRFETAGASSFRGFVDRLTDDAEHNEAAEAPVVEDGTDGVRIMTVHKAKGLEFSVVILVDPTVPHTFRNPTRHTDPARRLSAVPLAGCVPADLADHHAEALASDRHESVRVGYVAATRARDLLVVPAVGDEEVEGWLDVLHPALYPHPNERRRPRPASGCPSFPSQDSVLDRGPKPKRFPEDSVAPGLHRPRAGGHEVVWWDPSALELDKEHDVGLRQQEILTADEGGAASDAGARAHKAWQERRTAAIAAGVVPTLVVRAVTEIAAEEGAAATDRPADAESHLGEIDLVQVDGDRGARPHGKRFGTLVHAVLAEVDPSATPEAIRTLAVAQGRYLEAPAGEIDAAAKAVEAALCHPLLRRAAAAGSRRSEAPVLLPLPDGSLADGAVDLAFREDGPQGPIWTVVDFKTDAELTGRRGEYEAQLRLYLRAVSEATGEPARGVLLVV